MDRSEIFTLLRDEAVPVLGVSADLVTEDARFKEDLDADSLDLIELVMALEERLDVTVPEEELEDLATVGDAVSLLAGKLTVGA